MKGYTDCEQDKDYMLWDEIRVQAAIAAMQGLLANSRKAGKIDDYTMAAVDYADALIEQLKKKSQ